MGTEFAFITGICKENPIESEKAMVNPISSADKSLIIVPDSQREKNLPQDYNDFASINVEFSEEAKKVNILKAGSPLTGILKSEFDQVFGLANNNKELFLKKLDQIMENNSL